MFLSWGFSFVIGSGLPVHPHKEALEEGGCRPLATCPLAFVRQLDLCGELGPLYVFLVKR